MRKNRKISVTGFVMIWCSVIWVAFSLILVGMLYFVSERVERDLIREELSENMRVFARHIEKDAEGNFFLNDFTELDKGYYCVILDQKDQYLFGDCPDQILDMSFDSRRPGTVRLGGVHYMMEYRPRFLQRYAGIEGTYTVCGIAREDTASTVLETVRLIVYGFVLAALLLLLLVNLLLRRRIAIPLQKMGGEAQRLGGQMDFSVPMQYESGFKEIDTLAAAYQEVFRKMESVIESQNQFNSDVSHELRTPLTVIQAKSQVAREYAEKTENADYIETLEVIDRQTDKMKQMINDLMNLARLKSGEMVPARETFDLAQLVESVCEDESYVPLGSRELDCHLSEALITADVNLVVIAVGNILTNAVKYSAQGSRIRIDCGLRDGMAFCSIHDEGIGISPDIQDKIFDHFYRAEESRTSEGFGLGLTLTRKIMELHDGQVRVESSPGEGSLFTLLFPQAAAAEDRQEDLP